MARGDGRIYHKLKDFLALLSNVSPLVNHVVSIRYASTPRLRSTRNCVKDRQVLSVINCRHNVQQKSYWTRAEEIDQICAHKQFFRSERQESNPEQDFGQIGLLFTVLEERLCCFRRPLSEEYPHFK